jgi:hypothetical protein
MHISPPAEACAPKLILTINNSKVPGPQPVRSVCVGSQEVNGVYFLAGLSLYIQYENESECISKLKVVTSNMYCKINCTV